MSLEVNASKAAAPIYRPTDIAAPAQVSDQPKAEPTQGLPADASGLTGGRPSRLNLEDLQQFAGGKSGASGKRG